MTLAKLDFSPTLFTMEGFFTKKPHPKSHLLKTLKWWPKFIFLTMGVVFVKTEITAVTVEAFAMNEGEDEDELGGRVAQSWPALKRQSLPTISRAPL